MTLRKRATPQKPLTEVELEFMNVIWDLGECTVKEVQTHLSKERDLAYTSVATIMKILEQKGAVKCHKSDRAHTYLPTVKRVEYETSSLRRLATDLFRGDPTQMVMRLLSDNKLSAQELEAIRKLLDSRKEG